MIPGPGHMIPWPGHMIPWPAEGRFKKWIVERSWVSITHRWWQLEGPVCVCVCVEGRGKGYK